MGTPPKGMQHMNTDPYLDQIRRLIDKAPEGFDAAGLRFALATAEAAAASDDSTADGADRVAGHALGLDDHLVHAAVFRRD